MASCEVVTFSLKVTGVTEKFLNSPVCTVISHFTPFNNLVNYIFIEQYS